MLTYEDAEKEAILAAQDAIAKNYNEARGLLASKGLFGKTLDNKARKLALRMGGFKLPDGWTIARVTPSNWGSWGYRSAAL